jgi:hypothetical protein
MMTRSIFAISAILFLIHLNITAQENVGIGTTSPSYRLDVQGNASNSSLVNVNSRVNYAGSADIRAVDGYSVTAPGFGIGGKFTGGYKGLDAICNGGNYAGIPLYGVFGQATGTAGTRIGVYGNASGGALNYGLWGEVNGGTNHYGVFGQNTNLAGYAGYFNGRGFFTQELRADKNLVIDDTTFTGKIWGPAGPLQISSLSDITLRIDRSNNAGIAAFFELFNGSGNLIYWINEVGTGRITGNYYVDGNLGVGTNTPAAKFQILGGTDASLTSNGYAQFGPTNTWNIVIDDNEIMARNNSAANDLLFQQDAGNILMCGLEQGRVGIGVQLASNLATGYMLSVDGKIISEELRIQNSNNWPDYVFADQYELMPLDELKASIELNKHLPNIPSAVVVAEEGILIGDMQKRMMEKIEELTLYILDMNEANKRQQAEIEELKSKLSELKEK